MKRAAKAIAKALGDSDELPAAAREHRRDAGPAGPQLRRARRADRAARRRRADRRLPRLLPPARLRLSRSAPQTRSARWSTNSTPRSGSSAFAACTSTTRRSRSAATATITRTSARARSATMGLGDLPLRAALRGPAGAARDRPGPDGHGPDRAEVDHARQLHASRPSPRGALRSLAASRASAEVEGADASGPCVGAVEEARVDAVECPAVALVGGLDAKLALRQRLAGHLDAAEAAGRLGELEHVEVDLGAEDLRDAAHVAAAGELVLVAVEEPAADLEAAARLDQLVAEGAAAPALAGPVPAR